MEESEEGGENRRKLIRESINGVDVRRQGRERRGRDIRREGRVSGCKERNESICTSTE